MGWIGDTVDSVKSIQTRQLLTQAVSLGMIVTSALIIWKGLMCITGSESPVVVVLSGSMEPGFKRGDILFLHMSKDPIRAGEIVVFNIDGREIPIVHRVIKVHERQDTGEVDVLTKGDNNYGDDRPLYAQVYSHRSIGVACYNFQRVTVEANCRCGQIQKRSDSISNFLQHLLCIGHSLLLYTENLIAG
ncbi:Signal peptidase complex catalytic subunit SEC11A [Hibiscus syriacus]|uniref:Signal peptidase complex catalytic subunit SEC11 n=1 Tax=Hibiscus syriacus TaxID=106335 RepID=A0A6A2ZXH2_HIBSY|nr:Signal peptidase complex catalytic subunit SEC11A [Hibiscus syriacus]